MRVPVTEARATGRSMGRPDDPDLALERGLFVSGSRSAGGIDEVGRGALAGPLVVGVVVVGADTSDPPEGVRDSKQLSAARRAVLAEQIKRWCRSWSLGWADPGEIDELGISAALRLAAGRALDGLDEVPDGLLIDGPVDFASVAVGAAGLPRSHRAPGRSERPLATLTVVGGDRRCATIAAASIVAKVARDEEMVALGAAVAGYGFERHKGYGTHEHRSAIEALGVTPHHRRTWSPCCALEP